MTRIVGFWQKKHRPPSFELSDIAQAACLTRSTHSVLWNASTHQLGLGVDGEIIPEQQMNGDHFPVLGIIPPLYPEYLGDRSFQEVHNVRFAYVGGAMARGIASAELVIALSESGILGFFGAAGLSIDRLEKEIHTLKSRLDPQGLSWGMNLIHTPNELAQETKVVELYLKNDVRKIEAAAFMGLSKAVVHYAFKGLSRQSDGSIKRMHHVFAKISRPEVAMHFLTPVPTEILNDLVAEGKLTEYEAELGKRLCVAEDITVESDSGGHTDRRPLGPLFSEILQLRNQLSSHYGYDVWPRVGAAGGLGTPSAVASAFALGAAYVCIGSVHQSCLESGISGTAKKMLAEANLADVTMTACADMFEQGVKVQVLKKGTFMPQRGNYLYALYLKYRTLEDIPESDRIKLEKEIFRAPLDEIWEETEAFFKRHEPSQVDRAKTDARHKMALIFRWYIGKSSQWPIREVKDRQMDYQIWCGPAMGAFNQWVKGTFLEVPENRSVQQVALNLLEGAAVITKAHQLKTYGVSIAEETFFYAPTALKLT